LPAAVLSETSRKSIRQNLVIKVLMEDMLYCMQGSPILLKKCFLETDIYTLKNWEKLVFENVEIMKFTVSLNATSLNSIPYHAFLGV
jgi:hypothetical protein